MIEFDCPACRSRLYIKDEFAGKRGKCPHCSDVIDVPTRSVPPAEPPAPTEPVTTAHVVLPRRVSGLGIAGLALGSWAWGSAGCRRWDCRWRLPG